MTDEKEWSAVGRHVLLEKLAAHQARDERVAKLMRRWRTAVQFSIPVNHCGVVTALLDELEATQEKP